MSRRPASRSRARTASRRRTRAPRWARFVPSRRAIRLPSKRTRKRWLRAWRAVPTVVQWPIALATIALVFFAVNWTYQVIRKPSELFFPIDGALHKTPEQTWRAYGSLFRRHSTPVITAEFLAALAQVEASGNPVARTYWRWSFGLDPFSIYRPASSAVGMYQITDGTFEEARQFCIHDHEVVADGPWHAWRSCWLNGLYTRVIPSHAIELTSSYLHTHVEQALRRHGVRNASQRARQDLAALIHLCGAGAGREHARRGLRLPPGKRCGSHNVAHYLAKVSEYKARFARIAAREDAG